MSSSVDPLTISSNKEMFDNDLQVLNSTSEEVDPLSLRCLQEHNSTDMFEGKTKNKGQKKTCVFGCCVVSLILSISVI